MSDKSHICSCAGDQQECLYMLERDTLKTENTSLRKEVERLREENEKLKACPFCHKPLGKQVHINCGDFQGGASEAFKNDISGREGRG